jgi:hypothetical protein
MQITAGVSTLMDWIGWRETLLLLGINKIIHKTKNGLVGVRLFFSV